MQPEGKLLTDAIACSLGGKPAAVPNTIDWDKFCTLCHMHKVSALCYDGLQHNPHVPDGVKNTLSQAYLQAIFRDTQQENTEKALREALRQAGIAHAFLKGADMKHSYPIPALRTMTDMDILVHTKDYSAIDAISKNLGGRPCDGDGNHRNYLFPGPVKVEFHPNLLHPGTPVGTAINPGWQFVHQGKMTPEGRYLHALCHLASHFVGGGVGVRFVADIWVLRNLAAEQPDYAFVEQWLQDNHLHAFNQNIAALGNWWFGDGESTPVLEELAQYILSSGSHGRADREKLNALSLVPGGTQLEALLKKAFYPRQELESRYPWCQGKPYLLPAAWCTRAWGVLTKRRHLVKQWAADTGTYSKAEIRAQKEKLTRFGLQIKE